MPAKEWYERLERRSQATFQACADSLNKSFKIGRPDRHLLYKLEGKNPLKLHGIRVTKPRTRPHLRLLCVWEGQTLWTTHGFKKQKNETPRREIKRAEAIVHEWKELRGDGQGR
jgi:hypothetical protein